MPIKHFNYRASSSFYYIFVCATPPLPLPPPSLPGKVQRSEADELQRDLFIWLNVSKLCRCTVERMPLVCAHSALALGLSLIFGNAAEISF